MLTNSLRIAQKALKRNKLRTGLAVLGMTIGVAAVLTMFALGTGAQDTVSADVKSAGTTLIFVRAGNFTRGGEESRIPTGMGSATSLTVDDSNEIKKINGVQYVSPNVSVRTWVETSNQRDFTQIVGADSSFGKEYGWSFQRGKMFKDSDVSGAAPVAVIGTTLRDTLFGDENPVGKDIRIHDTNYRVVGVFGSRDDQAEQAVVPYTTLSKQLGMNSLQMVTVSAAEAGDSTRISDDIRILLRKRHRLDDKPVLAASASVLGGNQSPGTGSGGMVPDDFTVKTQESEALTKGLNTSVAAFILANMPKVDDTNMKEMSGTLGRANATMTALLAAIATISLIVGGIGIMNIMLVSVTERTREIGIRRAVGAKQSDVMQQFLTEAVALSLLGGVFGIVFGFIASYIITDLLGWPAKISPAAVALAVGIAAATGVFFGFYPAQRASHLNPIDALRYE